MNTHNELKHHKHVSRLFYLDKDHLSDVLKKMSEESHALKTIKGLERVLEHNISKAVNCPSCGGLVPEISFIWRGREYWFTCYKIVDFDRHEIVAETDYSKFAKYSEAMVKPKEDKKVPE